MKITKTQMITIGSVAAISITAAIICFIVFVIKNYSMKISEEGLNLIKNCEGLRLTAYQCSAGVWTIGYGHTKGVQEGDSCTVEEANKWLLEDVSLAESAVNSQRLKINQNQFDALVSFCFNVGVKAFKESTLVKKIKANPNDPTIEEEFARWKYVSGNVVSGLVNRREKESNLYFA
jgi:lysozyme